MYPAKPHYGLDKGNLYVHMLREALEDRDVHVVEYSRQAALRAEYDIIHLHWPDWFASGLSLQTQFRAFLRGVVVFGASALRRKPIVWTVHNLRPHGKYNRALLSLVRVLLAWRAKVLILLSSAARAELEAERHPCRHLPSVVIPIGVFPSISDGNSGAELRTQLGMTAGAKLVAHIGTLQAYKGVDQLIVAFRRLPDPRLRLLIAGEDRDRRYVERLWAAAEEDERIILEVGRLPDVRLDAVIRAADLVVLPYRSILNSATAIHALSAGAPVLLPDTLTFRELRDRVGETWVSLYRGDLRPSDIDRCLGEHPPGEPDLSALGWGRIADKTIGAYLEAQSWRRGQFTESGSVGSRGSGAI